MLDKIIQVRVDEEILQWLEHIRKYNNNYGESNADVIRTLIMREYFSIKRVEDLKKS